MAFTSGTATDYHDLLDKLRLYLVAQGWTELAWTAPGSLTDTARLVVRGPGAGPGQETFLWLETVSDGPSARYNWTLRGMTGYDSGQPESNQLNVSPTRQYLVLQATTIEYWFFVNDRRVVVVAKCGSVYTSAYLGLFLPWAVPSEYPFPLAIMGCGYESSVPSSSNTAFRFFADPGVGTAWLLQADNSWIPVQNQDDGSAVNDPFNTQANNTAMVWPYHTGYAENNTSFPNWPGSYSGYTTGGILDAMVETAQGERPLFPLELFKFPAPGELGALDGAYCVPGLGLVPEQQLTIGADTYRVFPNVFRTSGNDFMAIKEA